MGNEDAVHELGVTENILSIAVQTAHEHGAKRITDLYLVIGDLSSFVDESIQFYWDMLSAGTLAEGARLHFRRIPAQMLCRNCDHEYTPARGELLCPLCGGSNVKIIGGDEFQLESIDIE